jgi:hypothetical protein
MKHIICLISILCFICISKANTTQEIIGEWQAVEDGNFKWNFQKDGTLILKGPNGLLKALHWKIIEDDLLQIPDFTGPPAKVTIKNNKMTMADTSGVHELIRSAP